MGRWGGRSSDIAKDAKKHHCQGRDTDHRHKKAESLDNVSMPIRCNTSATEPNRVGEYVDSNSNSHYSSHRCDEKDENILLYCRPGTSTFGGAFNKNDETRSTLSMESSSTSLVSVRSYQSSRSSYCGNKQKQETDTLTAAIATDIAAPDVGQQRSKSNRRQNESKSKDYCEEILSQYEMLYKDLNKPKTKHKTELCRNYMNKSSCKYGNKCDFAHGEEELRLATLVERGEKGLIDDVLLYMTRPCHHFVSTGNCPFGRRCSSIHDPRVAGRKKSWLPHCGLADRTKLQTSVHVDWYRDATNSAIDHGHPFGPMFPIPMSSISSNDFLAVICNKKQVVAATVTPEGAKIGPTVCGIDDPNQIPVKGGVPLLSDRQRLFIANKMRHDFCDLYRYKFRPSHVIFDEICMVVQTRVFHVSYDDDHYLPAKGAEIDCEPQGQIEDKNGDPQEIDLAIFDAKNQNHVIVREIAFGPLLSSSDRHLALFFDIRDEDVHPLTSEQQDKCLRLINFKLRKKLLSEIDASSGEEEAGSGGHQEEDLISKSRTNMVMPHQKSTIKRALPVSFDDDSTLINKPFKLCTPIDKSCYVFVTDLLESCYNKFSSTNNNYSLSPSTYSFSEQNNGGELKNTNIVMSKSEERTLKSLVDHFSMFHLPAKEGREHVDKNTHVPKVNTLYNVPSPAFPISGDETAYNDPTRKMAWQQTCKAQIWESFVQTALTGFTQQNDCASETKKYGKCNIFEQLRSSDESSSTDVQIAPTTPTSPLSPTRRNNHLPHICGNNNNNNNNNSSSSSDGEQEKNADPSSCLDNEDIWYYKEIAPFSDDYYGKKESAWSEVKAYYDEKKKF